MHDDTDFNSDYKPRMADSDITEVIDADAIKKQKVSLKIEMDRILKEKAVYK